MCIDPKMHVQEGAFGISQQSNRHIFTDRNLLWLDANNQISLAINSLGNTRDNPEV